MSTHRYFNTATEAEAFAHKQRREGWSADVIPPIPHKTTRYEVESSLSPVRAHVRKSGVVRPHLRRTRRNR